MSHNCRRFEGKSAVITAATAGIGLGIAQRLGEEGAKLTICSRKQVCGTVKVLSDGCERLSHVYFQL